MKHGCCLLSRALSQNSARMQISWRFFVSRRRLKVNSRRLLVPGARCMHVLHAARRVSGSKPGTTPRPRTRPFGHHAALQIQCKRMHLCESASAHRVLHQHAGRDLQQRTAFDFESTALAHNVPPNGAASYANMNHKYIYCENFAFCV